ncbi:MAG: hypothetical protein FJ119_13255 [Deltaproteobacteria bacterium]|nr:hypothetical protein [Deltaproteobacteria bacterium]
MDKVEILDPAVAALLEHYAEMYAVPRIPTPLFVKNRVAKAAPDECYDNGTIGVPDSDGNCAIGEPKTNQAYVWGLAQSGNLWFGTAPNVLCLVMSIFPLDTIEAPNFVCEFDQADNATNRLGDWRQPQIFEYNPDTMALTDQTPVDMANPAYKALGLRSAGALDGVVLLAGPSFDGTAVNMFAFTDGGAYLGAYVLAGYNNIRQWVVYDGIMYTGVSTNGGEGRILRWNGDAGDPFQFEVVGKLDLDAANLAVHNDRLFVTTWPSLGMTGPTAGGLMGLWMSPEIPDDGLRGSDNDTWEQVWRVDDYEPDTLVARTYGGGALASHDGTLYWGTMHVPFIATMAAMRAFEVFQNTGGTMGLDLRGLDGSFNTDDIAATALGTHRAISIFSSTFETSATTVELLYGDEYLPVYDPASRGYTIAEDELHRNNMDNPVPKFGPSGIGNFFNSYTWTMDLGFTDQPDKGGVLLGTFDWSLVARELAEAILGGSPEFEVFALVLDQIQQLYASYGADLFVIQGEDEPFVLESKNGAGNEFNYGIRTMLIPDTGAVPDGDAPAANGDCQKGYLGMANPFNLAGEGGWELVEIYPLPELAVVAPAFQEFVQGDVVLQAQDFSACPLNNVVFYVTDIFAQISTFPAIYNDETEMWEYVLGTASMPMANGIYTVSALGTDDKGAAAPAVAVPFVINNDCLQDSDCDDGLWCTGAETCNETFGACTLTTTPCGTDQVCDEDNDTCVECLADADCGFGYECVSSVCAVDCPLTVKVIKDKPMRADAKKKVTRMLIITGGEDFNPAGRIDLEPLIWSKAKIKKDGSLKIKVTIPPGAAPGTYQISVGACIGEITIL